MTYNYSSPTAQPEYHSQFWDMARHNTGKNDFLTQGYVSHRRELKKKMYISLTKNSP